MRTIYRAAPVLVASSDRRYGDCELQSAIALEHRVRAHVVARERAVLDTRFLAPSKLGSCATIYALQAGRMQLEGDVVRTAPIAFALAPEEFEVVTPAARTFRTWGAPAISFELRLQTSDVTVPLGLAAGPLTLSNATWDAIRVFQRTSLASVGVESFRRVLDRLFADRVISANACAIRVEPDRLRRLWNALAAIYADGVPQVKLEDLRARTGLSPRQLARDTKAFARYFSMPGEGFRDTTRVMRLRLAAMLLSSPIPSISEIASYVGYKSVEAMGRAFRDAHLPPPRTIRAATRYDRIPERWR